MIANWNATKEECKVISEIVARAWETVKPIYKDRMTLFMDIEAVHSNGFPLDLNKLLLFDDGNFYHDIYGIAKHLDRNDGTLKDCFLPRCSK